MESVDVYATVQVARYVFVDGKYRETNFDENALPDETFACGECGTFLGEDLEPNVVERIFQLIEG